MKKGERTAELAIALLVESAHRHSGQSEEDDDCKMVAAAMPSRNIVLPTSSHDVVARKVEETKESWAIEGWRLDRPER